MMNPKVSIVILQYNNSQDTIRCFNSVKELDYPNYEVIIVDNGSEVNPERSREGTQRASASYGINHLDTIRHFLKNLSPKTYHLKPITSNLGYSGGNNIGIKHALEHGADYIFILNPDTTTEKDTLTKLIKVAESNPRIGILGPAIDEGGEIAYGGQIKWLRPELNHLEFTPTNTNGNLYTTVYKLPPAFYVPGAAFVIKKEVIEKIGLLDERYFLYFEDADYCERAKRADYKLAIVPEAVVHHKSSSSTSSLGAPLLLRYHHRNAHLFNWKNGPMWAKLALPFWSILIIIKQLAKIAMGREPKISKSILSGVGDFYRGHFGKINF